MAAPRGITAFLAAPAFLLACAADHRATEPTATTSLVQSCATVATDTVASLVFGSDGGPDGEAVWFERVASVALLESGGLAVADGGRASIFVFDAGGSRVDSLGGPGGGPGEFTDLAGAWPWAGGLMAFDHPNSLTYFGPAGGRQPRTEPASWDGGRLIGRFADGAFLVERGGGFRPTGVVRDTLLRVAVHGDAGPEATTGPFLGDEMYADFSRGMSVARRPFGERTSVGLWPDRGLFFIATGSDGRIRLFDAAGLDVGAVEAPWTRAPITAAVRRSWRAHAGDAAGWIPDEALPDRTAPFGPVVADRAGFLWVADVPTDPTHGVRWAVVNGAGEVQEVVRLPAGDRVMDATATRVAVLRSDSLGVERVAVYGRVCTVE